MVDSKIARAILHNLYLTQREAIRNLSQNAINERRQIPAPAHQGVRFVGNVSDSDEAFANHERQVEREEKALTTANQNISSKAYRLIAELEANQEKKTILNEYFSQKIQRSIHKNAKNNQSGYYGFQQSFKLLIKLANGNFKTINEKATKHLSIYQNEINTKRHQLQSLENDLQRAIEARRQDARSVVTEIEKRLRLLEESRLAPPSYNSCGREEPRPNMLSKGAENYYRFTLDYLKTAVQDPNNSLLWESFAQYMREKAKGNEIAHPTNLELGSSISYCFGNDTQAKTAIVKLKDSIADLETKMLTLRGEPVSKDEDIGDHNNNDTLNTNYGLDLRNNYN